MGIPDVFGAQLDAILSEFAEMSRKSRHKDLSDLAEDDIKALTVRAQACVQRATGRNSTYSQELRAVLDRNRAVWFHVREVMGVAKALRADITAGYLLSLEEMVHADLSSDYLEQASNLLESGYRDAAAVMIGAVLEQHLRALAAKAGIAVTKPDGSYKKLDGLNSELAAAGVLSKAEQKDVTAWSALRNDAAHGNYDNYDGPRVHLFLAGVRLFYQRHPA